MGTFTRKSWALLVAMQDQADAMENEADAMERALARWGADPAAAQVGLHGIVDWGQDE